jgi:hypothetical protein
MSSNRINITDLDFSSIKTNLKEFLRSQSTFSDYNFEGSSLNVLLDILAYNTYYNAYYMNMVANEAFLDSAILRNSVVSHAKSIGYTPTSNRAAKATIDIKFSNIANTFVNSLTLSRGTSFRSNLIENKAFNFVILEDVTVDKVGTDFTFLDVDLHQGNIVNYVYSYNSDTNSQAIFDIPDKNVDTTTLTVSVQESYSNVYTETYTLASDVLNVEQDSLVYFLQEGQDGNFQIYFGNGSVGKALNDGAVIILNYLVTDGEIGNDINNFTLSSPTGSYSYYTITNVRASSGGANKEPVDAIKLNAIMQYVTQNRLVTANDYEYYLLRNYPYIDSISIWGGEDQTPKVYGKVFISMKPKDDYYISEYEKERIINDVIKPKCVITTDIELVDPRYLYLKIYNKIKYNRIKTTLKKEQLNSLAIAATHNYSEANLNKFDSVFISSKLQEYLLNIDAKAIAGVETVVRVEKRVVPELNVNKTYEVDFDIPLYRGTILNRLTSSEIVVADSLGVNRNAIIEEIPESYTGISSILITEAGYNYTSTPTVTITGDGYGATAIAKIVNRRVESIELTNRGINYTKAIITISGGGGSGAYATAILDASFGTLRTVYFNTNAERQVINNNAGTIDYNSGKLIITDLRIKSVNTNDNMLRLEIRTQNSMISSVRNTILTIDADDASAVVNEFIS